MSFHKIAPVKKNCKSAAPAKKATKPAPKKGAAPKRRPIAPKG